VLRRLRATFPKLATQAQAEQLYARYVAGGLTWADVR